MTHSEILAAVLAAEAKAQELVSAARKAGDELTDKARAQACIDCAAIGHLFGRTVHGWDGSGPWIACVVCGEAQPDQGRAAA